MLDRIARDPSHVVTPDINIISDSTFQFIYGKETQAVGGFDWGLQVRLCGSLEWVVFCGVA